MKFKLLYFGDILINPKKRAQHIADIRMQFHPQLKKLIEHSPWNNLTQYMVPNPTKSPITTRHIGGIDWNPIITPNAIDILKSVSFLFCFLVFLYILTGVFPFSS